MRKAIQPFKAVERPIRVSVGITPTFQASTQMKPSAWMRQAAKLLIGRWRRKTLSDGYRYCMLGALAKVKTGDANNGYKIKVPKELNDVVGLSVPFFNDLPNSTERDCIAALQIAADRAEAVGR